MKTLFKKICFAVLFILITNGSKLIAQLTFTVINSSTSYSITCSNATLNLSATSNYTAPVTYLWINPQIGSVPGNSLAITNPGNYTVTASSGSVSVSQTLTIGVNTIAPSSLLSPTSLSVVCSQTASSTASLVALSPTQSIVQAMYAPYGGTFATNSFSATYPATNPGTYTYVLTDLNNGCKTTKYLNVSVNSSVPVYNSVVQNFTLGCSSPVVCALPLPSSSGAFSYTLIGSTTSSVLPTGTLGAISNYTLNAPGTWTFIIRDNTSLCDAIGVFSIISNTYAPNLSVSSITNVVSCNIPTLMLQGASTTPSVAYLWSSPGSTITSSSLSVGANFTSVASNTLLGNYSLTVTDLNNQCQTKTVVPVYQNIYPPNALISIANPSIINCLTPSVVLNNSSTTGIPNNTMFTNSLAVVALAWYGPPVQPPGAFPFSYQAAIAGTYTMQVKDLNNGCTSAATINVTDKRVYPDVIEQGPFVVACPTGTVRISPIIQGSLNNLVYSWTSPPGAITSGFNTASLVTNSPGFYTVVVTNTLTGCSTQAQLSVWACVGLGNNQVLNSFKVFPNPAKDLFTIELSDLTNSPRIEVYDAMGVLIKQLNFFERKNELIMAGEPKGVYFIRIIEDDRSSAFVKLIKE